MRFPIITMILVLLLFSTTLWGQSFSFLNQKYSARINALAGASVADKNDLNNILINPASLAFLRNHHVAIHVTDNVLDFKSGMIGGVYHDNRFGNFGLGVLYFDYGQFKEINRYAMPTGHSFHAKDIAVLASHSMKITRYLSIGNTVKYGYSKIDNYDASIMAWDFGVVIDPPIVNGLSLGCSILNLGFNNNTYIEMTEKLPTQINFGVTKQFLRYPVSIYLAIQKYVSDGLLILHNQDGLIGGIECEPYKNIKLRMGYAEAHHKSLSNSSGLGSFGLTLGFGLELQSYRMDYCYKSYSDLGTSHQFGITFNLSNFLPEQRKKVLEESVEKRQLSPLLVFTKQDKLILRWRKEPSALYNVYGRFMKDKRWVKFSEKPITENMITFEYPKVKGEYQFCITSILRNSETKFSETVTVDIE